MNSVLLFDIMRVQRLIVYSYRVVCLVLPVPPVSVVAPVVLIVWRVMLS